MNGRKRRALPRGAAGSPRARRGFAHDLPFIAALCPTLVDAGEVQQRRQQQPQRPQRGGSVASGPRAGRMLPEAVVGGDLEARGGRARDGTRR